MNEHQKIICKYLGGSHSYGLSTPASDVDHRGVFLNTEVKHLVGLSKHEHEVNQKAGVDESYKEFRHALQQLKTANTEVVEMLFNDQWEILSPEWELVIKNRQKLISSEKLYACLKGYMQGELRLANGERTGKLGGKRKEAIDRYGFSPKNFVQLFRLAWAGEWYFSKGVFPVNVGKFEPTFAQSLLDIKTNPERFEKARLNVLYQIWEETLTKAFVNRSQNTVFDEQLANDLCLNTYGPLIIHAYKNMERLS